jgi:hypothetical protein
MRWSAAVLTDDDSVLDSLVGVYITALYFLYFVVVKNTLGIFDCTKNAQVWVGAGGIGRCWGAQPHQQCVHAGQAYAAPCFHMCPRSPHVLAADFLFGGWRGSVLVLHA